MAYTTPTDTYTHHTRTTPTPSNFEPNKTITSDFGSQQHLRTSKHIPGRTKGRTTLGNACTLLRGVVVTRSRGIAPLTPHEKVQRLQSTRSPCLTFGDSSDPRDAPRTRTAKSCRCLEYSRLNCALFDVLYRRENRGFFSRWSVEFIERSYIVTTNNNEQQATTTDVYCSLRTCDSGAEWNFVGMLMFSPRG